MDETLFELPEPEKPREGTNAWKLHEFLRFREVSKKRGGLTTPRMASIALGVSLNRVYQLMDANILPAEEIMGKRYVHADDILELGRVERTCGTRYSIA